MTARWVDRWEKRLGFLEIPNLAAFMAGMNALCGALSLIKPEFPAQLVLDPFMILHGQVWRVFTFVLVPPALAPLWLFFWLMLYFSYLATLQREWGDYKLTLYVLVGALGTASASVATGLPLTSGAFVASLFLAFARLNPNLEILLFFILPVRMKRLAAVAWLMIAWSLIFGDYGDRVSLVSGLLNYVAFFGAEHLQELKLLWRRQRFHS